MNIRSIMAGLILILLMLVITTYFSPVHRWADGSTYFMQIDSISHDLDIRYEEKDIDRAFSNRFDDLPAGLYLIKNNKGDLFYAKEYTYSLMASPFYIILGKNGILVFNSVLFFLMIYMGYRHLKLRNSDELSFIISTLFFMLSTAFVYIFWVHPEIYNMFLITLGFFLWFNYLWLLDNQSGNSALKFLFISAIIWGVAAFAKMPSIVGILPLLLFEAYLRKGRNFILVLGIFSLTVLLLYGSFYAMTGNISPYQLQYYFVGKYPLWEGSDLNSSILEVPVIGELIKPSIFSIEGYQIIAYNLFYYLVGRFTGIFWYYPLILLGLLSLFGPFGRKTNLNIDLGSRLILVSIILYIFIYIYLDYDNPFVNYFGGAHAVGNRYFYIYPAFLFLIKKIEFSKKFYAAISLSLLMSLLFVVPIISHPIEASASPMEHTIKMPFKAMPIEYTELDNLPLWSPPAVMINNTTFYFTQHNVKIANGSLIFDGSYSELLLKSTPKKTHAIQLQNSLGSKHVSLKSGKLKKEIILNVSQEKLIDLPLEPVLKINRNESLYKIDISISPICLSDKRLVFQLV